MQIEPLVLRTGAVVSASMAVTAGEPKGSPVCYLPDLLTPS
ncbi:hypothetical protein [Salmonella enterica]|nr:hypothetical protein [Salmonella enterica]